MPGGKTLFTRAICLKAPYFGSIDPHIQELRPGYCEVHIKDRRGVHNHLGTVHAIAMCNMAELAGGMATEVTIPTDARWIPVGMTVEYLRKARGNLRAVATLDPIPAHERGRRRDRKRRDPRHLRPARDESRDHHARLPKALTPRTAGRTEAA